MYDALEDMRSLLKDKWGTTSIVGDSPEVKVIWEKKVVGFADYTRDTILLQPKRERIDYFGLYGSDFLHHVDIQIEIWTYMNQTRLDNMVKEVTKIIKNMACKVNGTPMGTKNQKVHLRMEKKQVCSLPGTIIIKKR